MKIVVLGTEGQLAQAFQRLNVERLSLEKKLENIIFLKREEIDFTQPEKVLGVLEKIKPQIIINSAAYTAVDKAESEKELAFQINASTPIRIAQWCKKNNSLFVHYSTDYVFDGSGNIARFEANPTHPVNYYGFTKRASEEGVVQSGCSYLIFRISWVYSERGNNFVKTMLRLGAQREELKVVNDQIGYPSYAFDIAEATFKIMEYYISNGNGKKEWPQEIFHLSSSQFATTWFQFAEEIFKNAKEMGFPLVVQKILPISSNEFPTPAKRPFNSKLNSQKMEQQFQLKLPDWKISLKECLVRLKKDF